MANMMSIGVYEEQGGSVLGYFDVVVVVEKKTTVEMFSFLSLYHLIGETGTTECSFNRLVNAGNYPSKPTP